MLCSCSISMGHHFDDLRKNNQKKHFEIRSKMQPRSVSVGEDRLSPSSSRARVSPSCVVPLISLVMWDRCSRDGGPAEASTAEYCFMHKSGKFLALGKEKFRATLECTPLLL